MYTYLLIAGFFTVLFFYRLGGIRIIRIHYQRWENVKSLVATRETNKFCVITRSIQLILETMYLSFLQYVNNSVRKIGKRTYEISYTVEGRIYKHVVGLRRGPSPVARAIDENGNDLTGEILPYLGPSHDWHKRQFSAEFFGVDAVTFQLSTGEADTFGSGTCFPPFNDEPG